MCLEKEPSPHSAAADPEDEGRGKGDAGEGCGEGAGLRIPNKSSRSPPFFPGQCVLCVWFLWRCCGAPGLTLGAALLSVQVEGRDGVARHDAVDEATPPNNIKRLYTTLRCVLGLNPFPDGRYCLSVAP